LDLLNFTGVDYSKSFFLKLLNSTLLKHETVKVTKTTFTIRSKSSIMPQKKQTIYGYAGLPYSTILANPKASNGIL